MEPRSVLVTGSSGLIGLPVAGRLREDGCQVVGFDHRSGPPGVMSVVADLRDTHAIYRTILAHGIDTIIHCGGVSGPMLSREEPFHICDVNVIATIHLMEAARVMGVRRFVYCSSAAAYGDTPPAPVADDAPLRPKDLYGATKAAVDLLLGAYRSQHGFDAVSLRISNAYGPGRTTDCAIRTMLTNALAGRPTRFDWGADQGRPYLFVDDAVSAIIAAARAASLPQAAYNVAGPEFVPMTRIGDIVRRLIPSADITFQPGLDRLSYKREALDLSAAARDLGYVPKVGIEQGVERYLHWMREQSGGSP